MPKARLIGPILGILLLAYLMALIIHAVQQPDLFGFGAILSSIPGALILAGITAPIPLILLLIGRYRPLLSRKLIFGLWALLCIALGVWAAMSPI